MSCYTCETEFEPRRGGGKPQIYCSPKCRNTGKQRRFNQTNPGYNKRYYIKHRETVRRSKLKRFFGITPEEYEAMLLAQAGVCAACKQTCPSGRRLAVDHNHKTGAVRKLLCGPCNTALGLLQEDPERILALKEYLDGYC